MLGGAADSPVDATGLGAPVTRNDISGQSAKVLVHSERILGVQAAASYTPELELEGLDQGFRSRLGAPLTHAPEAIFELAAAFDHRFESGWEMAVSASWAAAEDGGVSTEFGGMRAWSVGATVGRKGWTIAPPIWRTTTAGSTAGGDIAR